MNSSLMAILRLVHILAGIFWVGATLTLSAFVLPAARAVGPGGGPIMTQLMGRQRLQFWINIGMTLTILAGFALYGIDSKASGGGFGRSPMGITLAIGALLAIAAAGVHGAMAQSAARKLGAIARHLEESQRAPADLAAEALPLREKFSRAQTIMSWLLLLSATTMAIARYL
jgi:uncharacterized membrane protein